MINKHTIIKTACTDPYTNLAVEEFLTLNVEEHERILYLWQNKMTVVIGKNQNPYAECRVTELERDGGHIVRRLSGGGAVFHDLGNLNFTFITRTCDQDLKTQLDIILEACRDLGIEAEATGRNDITVDGKKFSGNAFYRNGEYYYHHGTLLINSDMGQISKYLTVDTDKLKSKGVKSVKSRVCNLSEYRKDLSIEMMEEAMKRVFIDRADEFKGQAGFISRRELRVSDLPSAEIEKGRRRFSSFDWIFGKPISFQKTLSRRFDWGNIELLFNTDRGKIKEVSVFSDAMDPSIADGIKAALKGLDYRAGEMAEAIYGIKVGEGNLGFPGQPDKRTMIRDIAEMVEKEV